MRLAAKLGRSHLKGRRAEVSRGNSILELAERSLLQEPVFARWPELRAAAVSILHDSIAETTRSSYERGFSSYLVFVRLHGAVFPPTEESLMAFATWLFTIVAKSAGCTRAYITGLRGGCVELGYDVKPFEAPRLARMYRGMSRTRRGLPITVALIHAIISKVWGPGGKLTLCAAAVVQFFGGFKCGRSPGARIMR